MNKRIGACISATLLAWGATAAAGDIQVMTQNQYLGGDIAPVIIAAGTPDFDAAVVTALQQVAASRTPERIQALAGEVLDRQPELVGMQEVWKFECVPVPDLPLPPGLGCDDPSIRAAFNDHLALTQAALGNAYVAVAQVTNLNLLAFGDFPGIPFFVNGVPAILRVTDRDVIFARSDVAPDAEPVDFGCDELRVSDDGCNYEVVVDLLPIGRVERGYVAVDVTFHGSSYRFVNTHLETRDPPLPASVQAGQMAELLGKVLETSPTRKLILVGDFNSDPGEPASPYPTPYMQAAAYGFYDGWLLRPGNVAGLTCCQAADLLNRPSLLSQRIDHIFLREMPSRVKDARVLGATANYRLAPPGRGLWPSDHAAVAATLYYR